MKFPKLNQMKIKTNNTDLFLRLGNLFPTIDEIQKFFDANIYVDLKELLNKITDNNINSLAIQYISTRSLKSVSSFIDLMLNTYGVNKILDNDYYTLDSRAYLTAWGLINGRYYKKWLKLYDTYNIEYNAIKPFQMEVKDKTKEDSTKNTVDSHSRTDTNVYNSKDKKISDITEDSVYGFNSIDEVPSDKSSSTSEIENTSDSTDTSNYETNSDEGKVSNSERDITRIGNIGNITNQQLIEQERDVWKFQIYDVIFQDLDKILTNPKYKNFIGGVLC